MPSCKSKKTVNSVKNFEADKSQSSIIISPNGNLLLLRAIGRKNPSKRVKIEDLSTEAYLHTATYLPAVTFIHATNSDSISILLDA
ncbi:hypothetical protein BPOR_0036g00220 [Botrytis porri]|uniref:Uncharacterized protein n=1 Tax=Botrytis porri TaxID=87229 RepID=A0A4Z1L2X9_9HELO|nr:hypothetical protein BPOR_0036g00220 [Botrytis porri]